MRTVEFFRHLGNGNAMRVSFDLERGQILRFVVQLECQFSENDEWTPVVRYDTAHGYAHRDRLHPYENEEKTVMSVQDYNQALTIATQDVVSGRHEYRRRYTEWLQKK